MNKISLYIAKTLIVTILVAMTLLVGLEFIFSLVNELRFVGTGHYGTWHAISYILLSLPNHISQMFPMSALVGTLLGLGILASRSELIVMRAAGMSMENIILAVLKLGVFLVVIVWGLGEWVAPALDKMAHQQKTVALSGGQALRTAHGIWMRDGHDFIHIKEMEGPKLLKGVTRYQFTKDMKLKKASFARFAEYVDDHWVLHDIKGSVFEEGQILHDHMPQQNWVSHLQPEILNIVSVKDLDELSLMGLWQTIQYREMNQLDPKPYQLAFWQKLVRPLATLVMMFLAIPFIFGPLRSATMGLRMLVGVLVGFAFYTFNQLFGPLTLVYQMPPLVGALLPALFFLGIGLVLLKRNP